MRRHFIIFTFLATCGSAPLLHAQTPEQPARVKLFASDTMEVGGGVALSRDGRWLALSIMESPRTASIWVQRLDGGAPQRLTASGQWDAAPRWSASGDAIFFASNRAAPAGDPRNYAMVIPFDAQNGRAAGPIRLALNEPAFGWTLSPDGQQIAFRDEADRRVLKVAPVGGGPARVVARLPVGSGNVIWSEDGRTLYFATTTAQGSSRSISRVPVSGGEPTVVASDIEADFPFMLGPTGDFYLAGETTDPRTRVLHIKNLDGSVRETITINRNSRPVHFTRDGRSLVMIESNTAAPTRIVPITGGAYKEITTPEQYDWVAGWSPDGAAVFTWSERNGDPVLARVPVQAGQKASGEVRIFPETKESVTEGFNSRYLFEASRRSGTKSRTLVARSLTDDKRHTITTAAYPVLFPSGPGGTWGVQENLLYLEQAGDQVHVKEWRGPGQTRTVRTLPKSIVARSGIAVHGDKVAWQQQRGDSVDIMIATGARGAPRRLLSMPAGRVGNNELAFSNDGRLLAVHYARGDDPSDLMAILDVSGNAPPRIIDTDLTYWYWSRWTPDNASVVVIGGGEGAEANVVRVPIAEGARPVDITTADDAAMWGFELSPDGRFIAYPGEVYKGQTVWKYEL